MNTPDVPNAATSCAGESAEDREFRKTRADRLGDCAAERAETVDTVARPTASAPTDDTNEPPS